MEKKEEKGVSSNPEPEFKNNRICCLAVQKWTSVIGLSGLVFHLFVGVTGTVGALAFGFNIFQLKEDSDMMTVGGALEFCKVLWIFTLIGMSIHAELLLGNAINERTSLLPWLTITWMYLLIPTGIVASSVKPPSFGTVKRLALMWSTLGFPLCVVHRRYNELRAWDRKLDELEKKVEGVITTV